MYPLESAPSSSKLFREWLGMAADVRLLSQTDLDDFLNRGCGSLTLGDKRDLRAAVQELQERGKRCCSLFFFLKCISLSLFLGNSEMASEKAERNCVCS